MFKESLNHIATVLPWGWKLVFRGTALLVGVLESCGLKFTAGGIAGTLVIFGVLKAVVAIGGPIPLTPGVMAGLGLWVAFLTVVLAHTVIDGILILSGEPPL